MSSFVVETNFTLRKYIAKSVYLAEILHGYSYTGIALFLFLISWKPEDQTKKKNSDLSNKNR